MTYIIFDTETTGLIKPSECPLIEQPKIIEIGAVAVQDNEVVAELSQLINPNEEIESKITKLTGIQHEDLLGKPTFLEFLPTLRAFFENSDAVICHNAPFDISVLNYELERSGVDDFPLPDLLICTVEEYRPIFGYRPKLVELYETIMGEPFMQEHRALSDVLALYRALRRDGFFLVHDSA